jgi:hypothetical protein
VKALPILVRWLKRNYTFAWFAFQKVQVPGTEKQYCG